MANIEITAPARRAAYSRSVSVGSRSVVLTAS